jgi:DNA-binding GntR family transcriptional regulator
MPELVVAPIERPSSAEQVANTLRRELLEGRIAPGTRLPDTHLAESLGVSRNTVREAMRLLAMDGLVVHSPHRGVVVAELTESDVADVYRARLELERAGVRAAGGDRAILDELSACVVAMAEDGDMDLVGAADLRFHSTLVAAMRSARLDRFYASIQAELRLSRAWMSRARGDPVDMVRTHQPVIDALERGDVAAAVAAIDAINAVGEQRLRAAIRARDVASPARSGARRGSQEAPSDTSPM